MNQRMLDAFIQHERRRRKPTPRECTVYIPIGTRLRQIIRQPESWMIWTDTNDFTYGTYLQVYDNGRILRVTVRVDEGDEIITVRPTDEEIANAGD